MLFGCIGLWNLDRTNYACQKGSSTVVVQLIFEQGDLRVEEDWVWSRKFLGWDPMRGILGIGWNKLATQYSASTLSQSASPKLTLYSPFETCPEYEVLNVQSNGFACTTCGIGFVEKGPILCKLQVTSELSNRSRGLTDFEAIPAHNRLGQHRLQIQAGQVSLA